MKRLKKAAITMAAFLTAVSIASCDRKTVSSTTTTDISIADTTTVPIGQNKINAAVGEAVTANDTVFTLNSIISPEEHSEDDKRYIYFDVTITNNTGSAYSLSTLNNFYLTLPNGSEVYEDVRTQLFAMSKFKEGSYFSDPFDIPANSEFKGIVGGFLIDKNAESVTVGFFPTKDSPTAKGDVILINVNAADFKTPDASVLK